MAAGSSRPALDTERQAKEYLVTRIMAEARELGAELSEVERKMLYFTETGWALPGIMDVNAEFERDYDSDEYESKIARIVRSIETKNSEAGGDQQCLWDDAVVKLSEGDHYLLVLIRLARSGPAIGNSKWLPETNFYGTGRLRPRGDFLRLVVVALVVIFGMVVAVLIGSAFRR